MGFPGGSAGKETTFNVGDLSLIPELEKAPGEGRGYPLQYSGLENYIGCVVHGVAKSWTRPSDFHFHFFPTLSQKPLTRSRQPLSKVCSVSRSPNVSKEARNVDFYVILLTLERLATNQDIFENTVLASQNTFMCRIQPMGFHL